MPVSLYRKVRFNNVDISLATKEYLFGPIGSKIKANIMATVSWGSYNVPLVFNAADDTIQRTDGGSFLSDGFRDNDSLVITGTASNNMSYAAGTLVVSDEFLYLTGGLVNETVTATIEGTTPIVAIDFYPNLVENSSGLNLFNLTDRETKPRYSADSISNFVGTPTLMQITSNSHGWVSPAESVINGSTSATIYKDTSSSTATEQIFVIEHTFTITPLFLANQLELLKRGNPPAGGAFKDRFALKYVYTIDAKFDAFDADIPHTSDGNVDFPKGQTGWYNEFVNGRPSIYSKRFISYEDADTGEELSKIDYCKENNIRIGLRGTGFTTDTIFIVHIMYLPLNENEYINTSTDYKTNFVYERAVIQNIGAVKQGENIGDYHYMKNVSASPLTSTEAEINLTVEFSGTLVDFFDTKDSSNLNYLIFVTTWGQVSTIIDVNTYTCDKDDETLFQVIDEWQFLTYPNCNGVGYSNFSLLPRDTVISKGQFYIKSGTYDLPVILKNISANLIATNSTTEFNLETFSINTLPFLPNCDNIQQISFEQDRDFIYPIGDCRNKVYLIRMPTLDITGYHAYEFVYPFKARWEEWRDLEGADRCFSYPTQNWSVYSNTTGWSIKFSVNASVEHDGHTTDFEVITWGTIQDPCALESSVDFQTFDVTGLNSFVDVIALGEDTFVKSIVYGDFTGYTEANLYGILTLDAWGVGGINYSMEIGTHIPVDNNDVWYGAGDTLLATLTKISDSKVEITAYINHANLPKDTNQFILSAVVRELAIDISSCDNMEHLLISFTCGEFEIIDVGDANTLIVSGIIDANGVRDLWAEGLVLVRVTDSEWDVTGGFIDGKEVLYGTITGIMQNSPIHPYTAAIVGEYMSGEMSGEIYMEETICVPVPILDVRTFNDETPHFFNDNTQMSFNS